MAHHRATFAEINLDAFRHNLGLIRSLVPPQVKIMAVVKADAYGHGAIPCARAAIETGSACLGVGVIGEAIELREAGLHCPILVLGGVLPDETADLVKHGLSAVVFSEKQLETIDRAGASQNRVTAVHLKIDTGMSRLGVLPKDFPALAERTLQCRNVRLEGICTHLSSADETDREFTLGQLQQFDAVLSEIKKAGYSIPMVHCANSAGILHYPQSWRDIVRPGLILYGALPGPDLKPVVTEISNKLGQTFQPVMQWKTRIIQIKSHPRGTALSYSRRHITRRDSLIATLPVGYADGLTRHLSGKLEVLVRGRRAPQVGSICMDLSLIDVTDIPGCAWKTRW